MANMRTKEEITNLAERNRIIDTIISIIEEKNRFLLLGHQQPDEDCISSLVSMALLIRKFNKKVAISVKENLPDQISYLDNICSYNNIELTQEALDGMDPPDAIFVLDTPKPDQISADPAILELIRSGTVPVAEIDHHLSTDASLIGTPSCSLVTRATSTCELIALLCCKIAHRPDILKRNSIRELFSRNLVLSMLTGMIGDTWFGLTVKHPRDRFFYNLYTNRFSDILREKAHVNTANYVSMTDIFRSLQALSPEERALYQQMLSKSHYHGQIGFLYLDEHESWSMLSNTDYSLFIKVIKAVTNFLAEKAGRFGVTVFWDEPSTSNLIQFRIRLSKNVTDIDLRKLLDTLSITDGGGHPGAIGFRFPRTELADPAAYVQMLLAELETL